MIPCRWIVAGLLLAAAGCGHVSNRPTENRSTTRDRVRGKRARLRVNDGGQGGLPVLFVHGNGGNRTHWSAQLEHLRATRRAVAFDLAGMGESELASDRDYSPPAFARDVEAVADALDLRRFVLVGHSYGGAVVTAYAGRHPDRVAGIVFADVAGDLSRTPPEQLEPMRAGLAPESYERFTRNWFTGILRQGKQSTKDEVLRSLRATPREVFVGATLSIYTYPLAADLALYRGPRLAIASYLLDNPHAIHRSIEGIPFRGISDASHWLMMDKPEEFNRFLDEFLAGLL